MSTGTLDIMVNRFMQSLSIWDSLGKKVPFSLPGKWKVQGKKMNGILHSY